MLFIIPRGGPLSYDVLEAVLRRISRADRILEVNLTPAYLGMLISEHGAEGVLLYKDSAFDNALKAALTKNRRLEVFCIQPINGMVTSYGVYRLVEGQLRIDTYPILENM